MPLRGPPGSGALHDAASIGGLPCPLPLHLDTIMTSGSYEVPACRRRVLFFLPKFHSGGGIPVIPHRSHILRDLVCGTEELLRINMHELYMAWDVCVAAATFCSGHEPPTSVRSLPTPSRRQRRARPMEHDIVAHIGSLPPPLLSSKAGK